MITNRRFRIAGMALLAICLTILLHGNSFAAPSAEIDLSSWGISDPSQIGYVSLGILHEKDGDKLVVYDVRKQRPPVMGGLAAKSCVPRFDGEVYLVSHFDGGEVNALDGYFGLFSKAPSRGEVSIERAPDGTPALSFSYLKGQSGYAGFWIHFFNYKKPPSDRCYLDPGPLQYLTFSIRGGAGGETISLNLADRTWEAKEDSVAIGDVGSFLPDGKITTKWQRAWIPLEKLPKSLDRKELAGLVFQANGGNRIYLKDLALTTKKDVQIPASTKAIGAARPQRKAMWLWKTGTVLNDTAEQQRLISFCKTYGITDLFLQIPYDASQKNGAWEIVWDSSKMPALIAALKAAGVAVYALDGDPRFALSEWHGRTLALIQKIVEYNNGVSSDKRFVGVRYDNEPYILPNFGGVQRESILKQYLDLIVKAKNLASAGGLKFGADIPFWFDGRNEFYEPTAQVDGRPVSELVIDAADDIGIMDYRTTAFGADGVIENALSELSYASKKGKRVFVGLETAELPDETIIEFGAAGGGGLGLSIEPLGKNKARVTLGGGGGKTLNKIRSVNVSSSKLTFAHDNSGRMNTVMNQASSAFGTYPAFLGFAVHSYESYRPWIDKQTGIK